MAKKIFDKNVTANESVSKYKLLSAYGGPGSIVHTQYGSIIISCIEEWGFLKRVLDIEKQGITIGTSDDKLSAYVVNHSRLEENGNIGVSNDNRLLEAMQIIKKLSNLKYLVLIPDIELVTYNNKIKGNVQLSIPSTYMPKVFTDTNYNYKTYSKWYDRWVSRTDDKKNIIDEHGSQFHPPKYVFNETTGWASDLKQDNIILLCEHGHISDFPWSKFLRWRKNEHSAIFERTVVNIFENEDCCANPNIKITLNTGNASGFDGKYIRCVNPGCIGNKGVSLKGLMGVKIKCPGSKPWESNTKSNSGQYDFPYSGNQNARKENPPSETCNCENPMKVALTTGNNIYYSRILSSIYLHSELFESDIAIEIMQLESEKKDAVKKENYQLAEAINTKIKELQAEEGSRDEQEDIPDSVKEMAFRYNEFQAFHKDEKLLNLDKKHLKVKNVTSILDDDNKGYFNKVLRIDTMKITSAQLDFSRVFPLDADAQNTHPKNIFRSQKENVQVYPVVENFGEGIFFSFNDKLIEEFCNDNKLIEKRFNQLAKLQSEAHDFNKGAVDFANVMNWQLYLVHTFAHLMMRELEFRCGYPTASLSERIYVSNDEKHKMYGCLIYTAEGAEGSMGGLIAKTREKNLNNLIKSALHRATICNSDPLCWESEGQGLFDLNFASCFSCSLVSETSCEHRNLYLDRRILVDENGGFFKDIINKDY